MLYDLLIKNGRVVDGSGRSSFMGDIGIKHGKILEIGKLSGGADKVIDADGLVVSPGFIDNHCHYDGQVTWDPLCSFSCYHGATTVIIGNCSLALAPVRPGTEERLSEFLSYVEAIPMDVLRTVDFSWETFPEYMDTLDHRLGVNVGTLIGHSAVRYYVMGDECQGRPPTTHEIDAMRDIVRQAIAAGALGLSISRERGHFDSKGIEVPAIWAEEAEIFALADVLKEMGTGVIQSGGGVGAEINDRLMSRLSEASGRQVIYNSLVQNFSRPNVWKDLMTLVDETTKLGVRAYPLCSPHAISERFTMRNCQAFRGVPSWHPIQLVADEEKIKAYSDADIRIKLHSEVIDRSVEMPGSTLPQNWYDYIWIHETVLEKNKIFMGKTISEMAHAQNKGIIDAFLDLAIEENLDTIFVQGIANVERAAVETILNYPNAVLGLSDGGAHVQFHGMYDYSTHLLSYWVREQGVMSIEQAIRRLTFESACAFGIYDRGLIQPGMAADLTIFDSNNIKSLPGEVMYDFPAGGWRIGQFAEGIKGTIVNGRVLIEDGVHLGDLPGRVLRNARYLAAGIHG